MVRRVTESQRIREKVRRCVTRRCRLLVCLAVAATFCTAGMPTSGRLVPMATAHMWRPPPFLLAVAAARLQGESISASAEELVVRLFELEGRSLVRLARLFVDDREAAEDIVQEAFLRLARHAARIDDVDRAPAYLRSIVLNLARDHNRRGLVSLRHHATSGREIDVADHAADELVRSEDHGRVLEAVRRLPPRQRDCITLRYFEECSIERIADTLGVSANSVKTHLKRAMASLDRTLGTR